MKRWLPRKSQHGFAKKRSHPSELLGFLDEAGERGLMKRRLARFVALTSAGGLILQTAGC